MSASSSDEYRANDNRCGTSAWASTTLSWSEQLVRARGLDFGSWGTWDTNPRRTGYESNWARSGANVSSLLSSGQHTGLAGQITAGRVQYAMLSIGENDIDAASAAFGGIYGGSWTEQQIDAKRRQMVQGMTLATDTVLQAGASGMVIVDLGNWLAAPDALLAFPNSQGRQRFSDFIAALNADIASLASSRGIALGVHATLEAYVSSRLNANGDLVIGGEVINLHAKGCDPHFARINDQTGHAGTVFQALQSNFHFIGPLNDRYGLGIPLFSEQDILVNAGMRQGGADTAAPAVAVSAPAANAIVSGPSTTVAASASDNVGVVSVQFLLDGVNLGPLLSSAPYSIAWDTNGAPDGLHSLSALARDAAGNVGAAAPRTVTVRNATPPPDTVPPTVTLTAPAPGSTVGGAAVAVSANASDNVRVVGVQFKRDGVSLGAEDTTAPYAVVWNTLAVANGSHVVQAVARDQAGNTSSAQVTVSVANVPPPVASDVAPYQYVKEKGTVRSGTTASVAANDTAYLVVRSNTSGAVRTTRVNFDFRMLPAASTVTAAVLSVGLKESAPPANVRISMWNYRTSAWTIVDTTTVTGGAEVLRSVSLTPSAVGGYFSAGGLARVQVVVDRYQSTTHDVSHDLVRLSVTQ